MMKYVICGLLAYLIGSLSPAALIARMKKKDLKNEGTGNLGATNTALVFGKMLGFLVMVLDILKGFVSVRLALRIVPDTQWFAYLAGFLSVLGHCFPFYLKFKGGKGLAAFAGVVLAYNPWLFLFLLITGVCLVLLFNSGTAITYYAATAFPVYVAVTSESIPTIVVCTVMSLFLMVIFIPNLKKAIRGQETKSRSFLKSQFSKKAKE